ncbi:MAG: carboxypeptidase regulatory-like domain-containing protein [Bacteroidales bacterium]|nr:carboxypeptidase regulatory-like domain-containing protein [Bacteroidales bacterium]
MKTFTKFFAFLFAFVLLGSMNVNAQPWVAPVGDMGEPLMEIWVYGLSNPDGDVLGNGDQIAAFDGDLLVGVLTISGVTAPSTTVDLTNWTSNRLLVFSKDNAGNTLYQPGHPIILKSWDGTNLTYAYTWIAEPDANAPKHIDFHDIWYAPTGDALGFLNQGSFFPPAGTNSYCYVDLDFTITAPTYVGEINIDVFTAGGTRVNGAVISSAGYTATSENNGYGNGNEGEAEIFVYWVDDQIDYTFTVITPGYATEVFTIEVIGIGPETHPVYLSSYGSIAGTITHTPLAGGTPVMEGALVSVTIGDMTYSDITDASGNYLIENIPDGTYDFAVTYPGYEPGTINATIVGNGSALPGKNKNLTLLQGTVSGTIYNAINLEAVTTGDIFLRLLDGTGTEVFTTFDGSPSSGVGAYSMTYNAGTYTLEIWDGTNANIDDVDFQPLTIYDYVLQPETYTENFNLMPYGHFREFSEVTGNPNKLWSIHIESAMFGSCPLIPLDEIAIYDLGGPGTGDDLLVGSLELHRSTTWQNSGYNVLKAFAQFSNGTDGFTQGNNFEFRAYDVSHGDGDPTGAPIGWSFNADLGTYSGSTFPDPDENHVSYLTVYWDTPDGSMTGTITSNGVAPIADATITIINKFTQDVVTTATTDALGVFNIELDEGTYDVKISAVGYASQTLTDKIVLLGQVTDIGTITLAARSQASQNYSFAGPGFFFFGRCVESTVTDMTDLFDNHGTGSLGAALFSQDYQASWIENDAGTQMTYLNATTWTNEFIWDLKEGYQLFIAPADATDHGTYTFNLIDEATDRYLVEPEDNPITFLTAGIYYIPYFPWDYTDPDDAITAFASILDKIDWVMDSEGNRLHKNNGNWVDNIGVLSPEAGYKIKTTNLTSLTFTYPAAATKSAGSTREMLSPVHFIYNEGNAADWTYTMNINTDDFEIGDEIAAYSNGTMVGSMVVDSEDAWENDLNTFYAAVDGGYGINTPIELMAWDASDGNEYTVGFEMVAINDNAYIGTMYPAGLDHFSYVNVYRGIVRVDENQIDNRVKVYPNPTNGTLNVESVSNIKELRIYNVYGALVAATNVNAKQQSMDVSNYTPGTYLVQLHTDTGVITKRVVVR